MKKISSLFTLFVLLFISNRGNSQIVMTDSIYIFEMKDGNTYMGKVTVIDEFELYAMETSLGILTIKHEDIAVIKKPDEQNLKDGLYWPTNPHSSRYFFSPSGYGLRKGEGYYQNAWIFFNQVSYGFSDYFTAGVGLIPTFLFGVTEALPVWITPKVNIPYKNGKGAFGAGSILVGVLGEEDAGNLGILYASNTFGTRDKQLTIGAGFGYSSEGGFSNYPTINVSGLIRTGKHWAFVTENYLFTAEDFSTGIISAGARYMGKRVAIDMGGFIPIYSGIERLFTIPWLSISVPFGKKY